MPERPAVGSAGELVAEMQDYYARRAPIYDASMRYDDAGFVDSLQPVVDMLCDIMRNRDALEIACGPAFWTQRVAAAARSIVATDYNETTLAMARRKPIDGARVRFVTADAFNLPWLDASFDAAFAVDFLAHVPRSRLDAFLRGLHKGLVPGSRVAFCDQLPWTGSISGVHDDEGNHVQQRTLADGSTFRVIKNFLSDRELRSVLAPHGRSVEIHRFEPERRVIVSYTLPA